MGTSVLQQKGCDVYNLGGVARPHLSLTSDSIVGVCALLIDDRRLTIRLLEWLMVTEMCNPMLHGTVHNRVKDKLAKWNVNMR